MDLSGKTAIVTGGGQGIGRAVAVVLAERGANVVVNGRTEATLDALTAELGERGHASVSVVGDVANRDDAARTVQAAVDAFGGVDIVVNNAQATRPATRIVDIDAEAVDLVFGSGAMGTLYSMQAAYPVMKERGGGVIVNMGSSTAITGDPGFGTYVMAKESIRGLSRVAANEWGKDGIRVNVVCPAALTSSAERFREEHADAYERMLKTIPLRRMGDVTADIANAIVALAGDDLQYLTGATLMLDGGRLIFP